MQHILLNLPPTTKLFTYSHLLIDTTPPLPPIDKLPIKWFVVRPLPYSVQSIKMNKI